MIQNIHYVSKVDKEGKVTTSLKSITTEELPEKETSTTDDEITQLREQMQAMSKVVEQLQAALQTNYSSHTLNEGRPTMAEYGYIQPDEYEEGGWPDQESKEAYTKATEQWLAAMGRG